MSKTHLIIPDQHAHPNHHNKRAEWLGKLIADVKPDVVVNIGDMADMPSLSSYDKGKKSFHGRTYRKDINSHLDFQDRLWGQVRKRKRRLPYRVALHGNHEERIGRAIESTPELDGAIGYQDLELERYYDKIVPYLGNTPGQIRIDGIWYAHYFVSGVMGRAIGGEHPAYSLITKRFDSLTCGHVHTADYCIRSRSDGSKIMGLVAGVFQDYESTWAGEVNKLWWPGIVIKRGVDNGTYDPEFVSLERIRKEYG